MLDTTLPSRRPNIHGLLLSLLPTLIIDGAIPFAIYLIVRPHTTDVIALGASAVPPALSNLINFVRQRRLDTLGVLVLIGIVASIGAVLITGDPKLLLVRESFLTGGLGLACLISLLLPKPLLFYLSRHFVAGNNPARIEAYNAYWQYPGFRTLSRLVTIVWGIGFVGEFLLRVVLIYTLSIPQVLVISPIVLSGISLALAPSGGQRTSR